MTDEKIGKNHPVALTFAVIFAVLIGGFAWGEHEGWPWLVAPVAKAVSHALGRTVAFSPAEGGARTRIQLWGGVSFRSPELVIGAPDWSTEPFALRVRQGELKLAYADLWSAYRGRPMRVKLLQAQEAEAYLSREADGRNSWTFGPANKASDPAHQTQKIELGTLDVNSGKITFKDDQLKVNLVADATVHMGQDMSVQARDPGFKALQVKAKGHYRQSDLSADLSSVSNAPVDLFGDAKGSRIWPVIFNVKVGDAQLKFNGGVDPWGGNILRGRFWGHGPSLAAAGAPFGLTLPTTGPFKLEGLLSQLDERTSVVVSQASLGSSQLAGDFIYDRSTDIPLLAGRLRGSRLALADLGPAIGVPEARHAAGPGDRVLPDRSFDLPSLAVMNANVLIDIGLLDVGQRFLKPLHPLKGHLVLKDSVLTISDLAASSAGGEFRGKLSLDGRQLKTAIWRTDLAWRDVQLDEWIPALKPPGRVPYATGKVDGRVVVSGKGKSTAAILGSLNGTIQARMREGSLSHLGVELVGIDLAQALGEFIKGDDALPVSCARADVVATNGVLHPDLFVISTAESTVWAEGSVSLVDEHLALQAKVAPKDFSILALRTPIQITGTLGQPKVSIEVGKLLPRVAGAVALGMLNPVAAIVPLVDNGNKALARKTEQLCQQEHLHLLAKKGH